MPRNHLLRHKATKWHVLLSTKRCIRDFFRLLFRGHTFIDSCLVKSRRGYHLQYARVEAINK